MRETVAVLDFGSQYAQLIARRIRECGVYCEILPHDITRAEIETMAPKAIVLSGGPCSVMDANHPGMDAGLLMTGIPILGICYGLQLLASELGEGSPAAAPASTGRPSSRSWATAPSSSESERRSMYG